MGIVFVVIISLEVWLEGLLIIGHYTAVFNAMSGI